MQPGLSQLLLQVVARHLLACCRLFTDHVLRFSVRLEIANVAVLQMAQVSHARNYIAFNMA
jgi:hypothetical protein